MRCQACGADNAPHELIEIVAGRPEKMRFCTNCLPDRVRGFVSKPSISFGRIQKQGHDLHLWLSVPAEIVNMRMLLHLAEGVDIKFPASPGDIIRFPGRAGVLKPDCTGDLLVHIDTVEDNLQL